MLLDNHKYNFIFKKLNKLSESYMQSTDVKLLNFIKMNVFYELCELFDNMKRFEKDFLNCKMESLLEVDLLKKNILSKIKVNKLPFLDSGDIIYKIKKSNKTLIDKLLKGYNSVVKNEALSYYSQVLHNELIFMHIENEQALITVGNIIKSKNQLKSGYCHFCNELMYGADIGFVSIRITSKKGNYSSIGVSCCLDYKKCNKHITSLDKFTQFIKYKGDIK